MERPSFGVVPAQGVRRVVEFDHLGHRVVGIEYSSGTDVVGDTCCVVQLRTPVVPTLVLTARTGPFEPDRFTPLEDAKLTKNTYSSPRPEGVALETVEPGVDLYKRFAVSAADPEFASDVLSSARDLLTTDAWFRVRAVVFHDGSLWTGQSGRLTDEVLYTNARHLARLAAAVPPDAWGDDAFVEVLKADTSDAAWARGGMVGRLNRRRRAADRQPVTGRSLVIRTVFALALVLLGLPLIGNGLAALTGLAPEVRLKVTEAFDSSDHEDARDLVSGTYVADGVTHTVVDSYWSTLGDLPLEGEAINVHIGPFWWRPMIEAPDTAVYMILLGLLPVTPGLMLARRTYLPRRAGGGSDRG